MPYCAFTLIAKRPVPYYKLKLPKTIGDHLKLKRLELKLQKQELAKILNVSPSTIKNWEGNAGIPNCGHLQAIVLFLGYWPYDPKIKTQGQRIKRAREYRSLTQESLAKIIEVDPSTVAHWERDEKKPSEKLFERLNCFFASLQLSCSK